MLLPHQLRKGNSVFEVQNHEYSLRQEKDKKKSVSPQIDTFNLLDCVLSSFAVRWLPEGTLSSKQSFTLRKSY